MWSTVLNSDLPPQRLRPDTRPEHQDPVSHMAQKKREKKRKKIIIIKKKKKNIKIKNNNNLKEESNQTNKQIHR